MEQASRLRDGGGRLVWSGLVSSGLVVVGMELEGCDDAERHASAQRLHCLSMVHVHSINSFLYLYYSCRILIFSSLGSTAFFRSPA